MNKRSKFLAAVAIATVLFSPVLARFVHADDVKKNESKPVVAVLRLQGSLIETPQDEAFPFSTEKVTSLKDLVERIHKARDDKNVKAVVLTADEFSPGSWAQIEELRQAIGELRSAGKDVYAHADSL